MEISRKIPLTIASHANDNCGSVVGGSQAGGGRSMFERIEVKVGQIYQETERLKGKWRVEAHVRGAGLGPHVRLCSLDDKSTKRTLSAGAVGDSKRFHEVGLAEAASAAQPPPVYARLPRGAAEPRSARPGECRRV